MATFQKDLYGKHLLVGGPGGNSYYFNLPAAPANSALPNQIANQVLEEIYIAVDTTLGAVDIYLPNISTFNLAWNAKIYIVALNITEACVINAFNSEVVINTINGFASVSATAAYDAWYLHIVRENMWMALKCPGPVLI